MTSQQVKWGLCPDATHYLPKTDTALGSFWRLDGSVAVTCWRCDGTTPQHLGMSMKPEKIARMIARYPEQPNWGKGPADASHWGAGCEQWLEAFYKFDGVDTYYVARADLTRHWVQLDAPLPAERIAQLIERPHGDFSGSVREFGSLPSLINELIDAYQGEADRSTYRVDLVDALRAQVKTMVAVDPAAPGGDKSVVTHVQGGEVIAVWERGLPPPGADCLVTPHNTVWGFDEVREYECKALAYNGEYVWLSIGIDSFVITRTDKVDFAPIRTAASDERVEAAQAWLKGIEQQYGQEVADRCEDILMEAENRKAGKPEPRPDSACDTVERDKAVSAMWTVLNARLPESYRKFDGEALRSALGILHVQGFRKTPGYGELLAALEDLLSDATERDSVKWYEAKRNGRAAIAKARGVA